MDSLSIDDYWTSIPESKVVMAMDDDVLSGARNKQYAKMAKKNKVTLVVLAIENSGEVELSVPRNLIFLTSSGDTIQPLPFEEAMALLVDPITDKEDTDDSVVEVEGSVFWDVLWGGREVVNASKIIVSHVRFIEDMQELYVDSLVLAPGLYLKGFLVLPVKRNTAIEISLRPDF